MSLWEPKRVEEIINISIAEARPTLNPLTFVGRLSSRRRATINEQY